VVITILKVNRVEPINSPIIYQMFAVEAYNVRDAISSGNSHMTAIVIHLERVILDKNGCDILVSQRNGFPVKLKYAWSHNVYMLE
jgi:hypothetical protein